MASYNKGFSVIQYHFIGVGMPLLFQRWGGTQH